MPTDTLPFEIKAVGYKAIADSLPQDIPSMRELQIQIDKLERTARKFNKDFPWNLTSTKKDVRKKKGLRMHGIAQQAKRVDALVEKAVMEWGNRDVAPNATPAERKKVMLPAVRKRLADVESTIHEVSELIRKTLPPSRRDVKQIQERARKRLATKNP
jgi:hypothetical protein